MKHLWFAIVCLASACGGSADTNAPPDGPGGPKGPGGPADPNPDGGATASVGILQVEPADGAIHVSPLTQVVVTLSGAVDPASVTTQTVQLWVGQSKRAVLGTVSYDAVAHAIAFAPRAVLAPHTQYRLTVDGVTASEGHVPATSSGFRTLENAQRTIGTYSAAGVAIDETSYEIDGNGQQTAVTVTTFSEGNRQFDSWTAFVLPAATLDREIHYGAPGPDGVWRTADDVITWITDVSLDPDGAGIRRIATYRSPGADQQWTTPDDTVGVGDVLDVVFDDADRVARNVTTNPGPDGRVPSADDVISEITVIGYPASGTAGLSDEITYSSPGPDGTWLTPDDRSTQVRHVERDDRGLIIAIRTTDSGPDGTPNTIDDTTIAVERDSYSAAGELIGAVTANGPGPDGVWGTGDDRVSSYFDESYDNGARKVRHVFSAGPDGIMHTADDYVTSQSFWDTRL